MTRPQRTGQSGKRPLSVTLTICWGLLLGLLNGWQAIALFRQGDFLLELGVNLNPQLRAIAASAWAGLFVLTAIGVWRRRPAMRWLAPFLLILFAAYQLVLTLGFVPEDISRAGWPIVAGIYGLTILFSAWSLTRTAAQSYFESEDTEYGRSES